MAAIVVACGDDAGQDEQAETVDEPTDGSDDAEPPAPSPPSELGEPDDDGPLPDPEPEPEAGPERREHRELPDDLVLTRELLVQVPEQATSLAVRPGDDRLFVADKGGRIWIVDDGELHLDAFLDLSDQVLAGGQTSEQGLLSLTFHPEDGDRLIVYYVTDGDDDTRLAEFRVDPSGDHADPDSERVILEVEQPFRWHNGGQAVFGPDGMLWLSLGDGGISGDPDLLAQDPTNLLGSIVRIDVDGDEPYTVPDDNPFAIGREGAPEVWAYGLRNPWRIAFDHVEWLLYVADVGQHAYEWINVVGHEDGGANFGWPILEGSTCFAQHSALCSAEGFVDPILEYGREEGACAIIGGHVYDGQAVPELAGHYFYTDLCAGWLRSFRLQEGEVRDERDWTEQLGTFDMPVAVAADHTGELLVSDERGSIWRIVPDGEAAAESGR